MNKTNWKEVIILTLVLILSSFNLFPNEVLYSREEQTGLSFLHITDFVKDSNGFIWFGTTKGLNRWDGYNYKHYYSDKNDTTTISSNRIQALHLSKNNLIWVGTSNGLNLFDPKTEEFKHFLHNPGDSSSILSNNILCIEEDNNGNIWIGTDNGLNLFNIELESFTKIEYKRVINTEGNYDKIHTLFCDSKNIINIGFQYSGLIRIDATLLIPEFLLYDKENNYINSINNFIQIDDDNLLFGTWGGKIFNYSIKEQQAEKWKGNYLFSGNVIEYLKIDHNGNYWIVEKNNQILHLTPELEIIDAYSEKSEYNKIPSNQITSAFADDEYIWFGTLNHGYFQIRYSQKPIRKINWEAFNHPEIYNYQITSSTNGKPGELIFGTANNAIIIYNEGKNNVIKIPIKNKIAHRLYYDDYRQKIFYGTHASDFNSININSLKESTEIKYSSNNTQYGIASNDSLVFIGIWANGINILHNNGVIEKPGNNQMELFFSTLNCSSQDENLWLATFDNGLIKYNLKTKQFKQYLLQNKSTSLLATNQVNIVKCLKNGEILVSTNELGLCYFDTAKEEFNQVGNEIGINNIQVKALVEDDNQNIWIVSESKIIKTNLQFSSIFEYTVFDGVNYGIEHLAAAINFETNKMYIGGQEGIQYFTINNLIQDSTVHKVVITNFKVFEKELNIKCNSLNGKSVSYLDSISLTYKENFITIEFSSMQFYNQTNREFSYKLSGVNNNWITVPNHKNSVTYSNLSPGNYLFEVKVSSEHGIWNDNTTKLNIIISPPFWLTSWFRFIILVFIVSITVTFIRLREYSLVKEKKKLELLIRERTSELRKQNNKFELQNKELEHANHLKNKFFNIIAHDLKNPVSSIVQLTDLLKENLHSLDKNELNEIVNSAANSANSTMELLEDLLEWARSQTNKISLNIEPFNISSIVRSEELNLNQQAKNKNITIKNIVDANAIVLADKSTVRSIIRNLLSNAIKFSYTNSSIIIDSKVDSHFLKISVIDNGVGISYSKMKKLFDLDEKNSTKGTDGEKGTGLGLSLCNEFIKRNGGEFKIESSLGEGSVFSFTLPIASDS